MKLLILGGTRYLGPALVASARAGGHEITLFNRGKSNPGMFPDLETLIGDRNDDVEALKGRSWDAVIDTSAYLPAQVELSTGVLADAVAQYVLVSTLSVYARRRIGSDETEAVGRLTEEQTERVDAWTMRDVTGATYGPLKALCEEAAEDAMPGRVARVRPGLIVGPRDRSRRFHYWPWRMLQGGEILAPGPESGRVQIIDVRDTADFCLRLVDDGHVGVFNTIGPAGTLTFEELLYAAKGATSVPGELIWADAAQLVEQGFRTWSPLPLWTNYANPDVAEHNAVSNARAVAHGLTFRPLHETCRAIVDDIATMTPDQLFPLDETMAVEERVFEAMGRR